MSNKQRSAYLLSKLGTRLVFDSWANQVFDLPKGVLMPDYNLSPRRLHKRDLFL